MKNKINILTLGDHPLHLSGVAHCIRDICASLLKTGKFTITSLGAAIHHDDMRPVKLDPDWDVFPVEGFGTIEQVHQMCKDKKIDIIFMQSDPRFYNWFLVRENEIRRNIPIVWYTIWDNYPYPIFNNWIWNSVDYSVAISKLTEDLIKTVCLKTNVLYQPHTINKDIFKPLSKEEAVSFKKDHLPFAKDKFLVFWNNRNGRRKNVGMLVSAFTTFANRVGKDKVCLLLKTDPVDQVGYNIPEIIRGYEVQDCVIINAEKLPEEVLCKIYNATDVTVNISNNEGFGLCAIFSTKLDTYNGLKRIKDIIPNEDWVMSDDGKYHKVLNKKQRFASTLKIKTWFCKKLEFSDNHPFYAIKRNKDKEFFKQDINSLKKEWVEAKDLKSGDLLAIVKPDLTEYKRIPNQINIKNYLSEEILSNIEEDADYIWFEMGYSGKKDGLSIKDLSEKYDIPKYVAENVRKEILYGIRKEKYKTSTQTDWIIEDIKSKGVKLNNNVIKVRKNIPLNKDFYKFCGWYLAEGSNSGGNGIEIDLHKKEINIAEWCKSYIYEIFELEGVCEFNKENSCRFYCSSMILSNFFGNVCGIHSNNKKLHIDFLNTSSENQAELIKACLSGDGHNSVNTNTYSICIVSEDLINQLSSILLSNNILSSVKYKKGINRKFNPNSEYNSIMQNTYKLSVGGTMYDKLCMFLNIENQNDLNRRYENNFYETDRFFFVPIRSIERDDTEQELYDIQVEDSSNFVAERILVHNSMVESLSCGTPIISTWTGGMREQICDNIDDPKEFFGVPLFPATKTLIGSPELPWINEDQCSEEDLVEALIFMYEIGEENRHNLGMRGREHVLTNFSWDNSNKFWPELFENIYDKHGSWPNKLHQKYRAEEITCLTRYESTKKPTDLPPSTRINKTHFLKFLQNSRQ